jgi:hypothetical protein
MTEPEILDRVHALKVWLNAALRRLADLSLSTFDRRELRNQMRLSEAELRIYFERRAEGRRLQIAQTEAAFAVKRPKPDLRLLGEITF